MHKDLREDTVLPLGSTVSVAVNLVVSGLNPYRRRTIFLE